MSDPLSDLRFICAATAIILTGYACARLFFKIGGVK